MIRIIRRLWAWLFQTKPTKKSKEPKLSIELVPLPNHGANVRSRITEDEWKQVCKTVHRQATIKRTGSTKNSDGLRCVICHQSGKSQGFQWPVECHEVWHYSDQDHSQKLTGMLSLCPMCHKAKHYGLAVKQGYGDQVRAHLMRVNGMSERELNAYIKESIATVEERSAHHWTLDLTYLNKPEFQFLDTQFTKSEKQNCRSVVY